MRYVRDQTGRFSQRPHYEPRELDAEFEKIVVEFLRVRHGKVEFPITTDDLTVLIERDAQDLDVYADLTGYAHGVEGVTEFWPRRKPTVRISAALANSENHENRLRTTMTHEYGHVHLHSHLFAMETGDSLFDRAGKPGVIACKRDTMLTAVRTDWMEWQAGYACGAILMPATRARATADAYRRDAGVYGAVPVTDRHGQAMIDLVAGVFQVSREAARVRLSVLGILGVAQAAGSLLD